MDHVGIDLGKMNSQICILTESGEVVERRVRTERSRFAAVLSTTPKARVLIEASTESEWVARLLEELGHEVIVADPNYAPMYAQRTRKLKTDRRDAQALAAACRQGTYRCAHRASEEQRRVRGQLAVREALVRTRTRYIALIGSLVRREGKRVPTGNARAYASRLERAQLPPALLSEIAPLLQVLEHVNHQIKEADAAIARLVAADARVRRLCTVPGVGPVTATAFVATLDRVERFTRAHEVEAYLGLVPRENSSGERRCLGRITKAGNRRLRYLLVEAAWAILRSSTKTLEAAALRIWATRIAARRGKKIAAVALARRLAGILFALLRDGTEYRLEQVRSGSSPAPQAA